MLEREFNALAEQWREETSHLSFGREAHFAYQQIIGMGDAVLPIIFRELEVTTSDWFWALSAIARKKARRSYPRMTRGRVRKVARIWMDWGRQHGYV